MLDLKPVYWEDGAVKIIDQTRLPEELVVLTISNYSGVVNAIQTMQVRGAPAIGVAAALGIALGAASIRESDVERFLRHYDDIAEEFRTTRPTAINLFWAIDRMILASRRNASLSVDDLKRALLEEALSILNEDIEINRTLGRNGAELISDGDSILTHCNAGALATAGYGTALGVIRAAVEAGKHIKVFADETRPRLQGMKLTAWELVQYGIPVTVITDGMAGWAMYKGMIDKVIVGADRIAANGDTANKVGTYSVAVLAKAHNIPFYVAVPVTSLDMSIPDGGCIPIEERCETEVTHLCGKRIAPDGVSVCNPAFDITPADYITAIITERGVLRPPFIESLSEAVGRFF